MNYETIFNSIYRCEFTGTSVVVPNVAALNMPGAAAESSARHRGEG